MQAETAEGQCAGDMRRKQGAGFTPSSNRGGDRFPSGELEFLATRNEGELLAPA